MKASERSTLAVRSIASSILLVMLAVRNMINPSAPPRSNPSMQLSRPESVSSVLALSWGLCSCSNRQSTS